MTAPLDGVRVVEAATFLSGPYTGQILADLGAEVIKVEPPPGGDPFRRFNRPSTRYSPVFANCNRGKQSVMIDLKDAGGRAALLELIAAADVWITNWRPQVAARLGLDDDVVAGTNPRLVRLYISGYGADGPKADAPAFDTIVQAASGLTHALSPDEVPEVLPGFPVDKITAMMAAQSVLAALYARERTGTGEKIELSMLAAAAYVDFVELFANRTFIDHQPQEAKNLQAIGLRPLRAKDGWLTLAPVSGTAIKQVCEAAGHPEWADELRSMKDQTQLARALFARLDDVLPSRTVDEWITLLKEIPIARCLTIDEHLQDAQVQAQEVYRIEEWDGLGPVRAVRYPAAFGSTGYVGAPGPAPDAGADNDRYI